MPSKRSKEKLHRRAQRNERAQHKRAVRALQHEGGDPFVGWAEYGANLQNLSRDRAKNAFAKVMGDSIRERLVHDSLFPKLVLTGVESPNPTVLKIKLTVSAGALPLLVACEVCGEPDCECEPQDGLPALW